MNRFIDERKNNWQQLENLLAILETSTLRGLSRLQVRELGELYRRAAADLAIARAESRDPRLVNYLNSLVIRAHGNIYRAESGVSFVRQFFGRDFPRTFRRHWRFVATAFAVFGLFAIVSFVLCFNDPSFADILDLGGIQNAAQNNDRWWESLNDANQIGSSQILTNNILVTFRAFAYGAFFGLGTIFILIQNGLSIGGVLGVCYRVDPAFGNGLVTFMVGHGAIELSCIFIAAGAGLLIGYSMINPGDLTRTEALKKSGIDAVKLAIGCACLLVVAGIIEGFLSPSALPAWIKFGTGILTGSALYSYLFLVGRDPVPEAI
jgi:uncharacterized membrane protein SpoIIM required for sporulation